MKRRYILLLFILLSISFTACGKKEETINIKIEADNVEESEAESEKIEEIEEETVVESDPFEDFLNGKEDAYGNDILSNMNGECYEGSLNINDLELISDENERVDVDNDGEDELVLKDFYGGIYIDKRYDEYRLIGCSDGMASRLFHIKYKDKVWLYFSDFGYLGREGDFFYQINEQGQIVDQFSLYSEFDDKETYDENSDFYINDQKVTMEEYENLKAEIWGQQ